VKQRGVALIVVLLIVAMVTIIATEMAGRLQLQVRRAANLKDGNQAFWYALSAEEFAAISIRRLYEEDDDVIHIKQPWASSELAFPLQGGGIQAQLEDMQSCLNLNALLPGNDNQNGNGNNNNGDDNGQGSSNLGSNERANAGANGVPGNGIDGLAGAFHRLLRNDEINVPSLSADTLKDSLIDWLDEDSNLTGSFGAEDPDYESKQFPYLAANGLMTNKTELRLVKGAALPWINDLMPFVCAIPNESNFKLNVNTLTPEKAPLLAALTGVSVADATNLIGNIPYDTKEDFLNQSEVASQGLSDLQKNWFDVTTRYFILHTKASYNNATFAMSTVFKVDESKNVQVVRREFGGKL